MRRKDKSVRKMVRCKDVKCEGICEGCKNAGEGDVK